MLDLDLDCGQDECGGPGPPPEFLIPPPPRPPFLAELANCNEDGAGGAVAAMLGGPGAGPFGAIADGAAMCEAIPILDASYHSSPSFQTSAVIVLSSVLLLLVIFISSLLVWKHKRKVQNFLPCKTPTRGGPPHHLDATGVHSAAHSVTYEDPDVHLGHHPLVMRHHHHHHHHHNMEQLHHPKQLHYPSGYPMPRSPPLFICSSPGPDPYRSHDNVYEELEHPAAPSPPGVNATTADSDSEPGGLVNGGIAAIHSDDDFAEDELSLNGEQQQQQQQRSFHKSTDVGTGTAATATTVATIYHESGGDLERNRTERNSLLSCSGSSSAGNDHGGTVNNRNSSSSAEGASSSSSGNNNTAAASTKVSHNPGGGFFRSRKQASTLGSGRGKRHVPADPPCEMGMTPMAYDERAMMTLPPSYAANHPAHLNSINNNIHNSCVSNSNSLNNNVRSNYYSTIDDEAEVERRNRINAQLSAGTAVSTIFRGGRPPYSNNHHSHHQQQQPSSRSRTNPRSLDRRRYLQNNNPPPLTTPNGNSAQDPSQYIYHEPVFHEGLIYDGCLSYSDRSSGGSTGPPYPYALPAPFTTFRNGPNSAVPNQVIYSRDSSFGSDSGYSQHTQASNRSGNANWTRNRLPPSLNRPPLCEPHAARDS
ncbi:putative uncharacterized protein DDB_G0286901 [Culex quinquefasciatus]|uniref:putative uncharacterized protein DDB_G0286901 n=1 Tax=Culex quinquefasciatus TaxID=7176 RepID=UPI0018E3DE5F|nr:putative uncharacterized protein DDB_G0286901 [Culex quinquefasciatus]